MLAHLLAIALGLAFLLVGAEGLVTGKREPMASAMGSALRSLSRPSVRVERVARATAASRARGASLGIAA